MEDNKDFDTQNEEQEIQQNEKRYTQAEVEDMIKRRLARERKKANQNTGSESQHSDQENTLAQRELAVMAKERLLEEGLPSSLAGVLRYNDEDTLDAAIEAINNLKKDAPGSWGQKVSEGRTKPEDSIRKAMGLGKK